jgi:uncharacterized SAM-binding protein YcdF (DUF218 family)
MSYSVSKLAISLLSPLGIALAVWLLIIMLLKTGVRRFAAGAGLLCTAWLWIWSTPYASDAVTRYVEAGQPAIELRSIPLAQAIIVLGGAIAPANAHREYPDMGSAADRVWHASRIWKAGKAPLILLSGGSDPAESRTSEAEAMRVLLIDLGVSDQALVLEPRSRTTRENAKFSAAMLRGRGINQIILVTSASHMPRAVALFRAEGFDVIPASTDFQGRPRHAMHPALQWVPDTGALDASSRAIKEIVGRMLID